MEINKAPIRNGFIKKKRQAVGVYNHFLEECLFI